MMQFELMPRDGRTSFYGKAIVNRYSIGMQVLKSYNTNVCYYNENTCEFVKTWGDYSATTLRHVNAFRENLGLRKINKKDWLGLPCGEDCELSAMIADYNANYKGGA